MTNCGAALQPPVGIWIRITSVVSVVLICVKLAEPTPWTEWSRLLILVLSGVSTTWCCLAWLESSPAWFIAAQVAIVATGTAAIDTRMQRVLVVRAIAAESALSAKPPGLCHLVDRLCTGMAGLTAVAGEGDRSGDDREPFGVAAETRRVVFALGVRVDVVAGAVALGR